MTKRHALINAEWRAVKKLASYKPPRGPEPEPETIKKRQNRNTIRKTRDHISRNGPIRRNAKAR